MPAPHPVLVAPTGAYARQRDENREADGAGAEDRQW